MDLEETALDNWEKELAVNIWRSGDVTSKFQSYALFHQGLLGNKPQTWNSLNEIKASGWDGKICIRSRKGIDRSRVEYNKTYEEAEQIVKKAVQRGIPEADLTFNESMPDNDLALQGEVMILPGGLYLYGTTVKRPMNLALAEKSFSLEGAPAQYMIGRHLNSQSLADLERLLEAFPKCAIEFSAYDTFVGNLPARNTVFWEVRDY